MNTNCILKLIMIITVGLFFFGYVSLKEQVYQVIPEKEKTVDNFDPTTSRVAIKDGGVAKKITREDKHDRKNIIKDSDSVEDNLSNHTDYTNVTESKNTAVIKPQVKGKIETSNSRSRINNANTSNYKEEVKVSVEAADNDKTEGPEIPQDNRPEIPKDNKPEIKEPLIDKEPSSKDETMILCKDAWFDESKPCDHIPDNLKPTDELGRSVPHFFTSEEAWNWGELQIEDKNSKYGCRGFTRMDGYQNDGSQFFFVYLKVCDIN